jgi:hypothetical protein
LIDDPTEIEMADGYVTLTRGATGAWIAWHTQVQPPANATGREIAACAGPVLFAYGPTEEDAVGRLRLEIEARELCGGGT